MEKFTIEEFKKYIEARDSLGDVLYYLNEENVRKANLPKDCEDERIYNRNVDEEDDDIFTVAEWHDAVADGYFCDYDGSGYWMKNGMSSRDDVFGTPPLDATHVVWFNK